MLEASFDADPVTEPRILKTQVYTSNSLDGVSLAFLPSTLLYHSSITVHVH